MLLYRLTLVAILLLLVLFQAAFVPVFTDIFPDLLLIIVLALCWLDRRGGALWTAFIGGVFFDFLAVRVVGVRPILLIAAVGVALLIRRLSDNIPSRFLTAFLISFGWRFYPAIFANMAGLAPILKRTASLAALDGVVFIILLPLLAVLFERLLVKEDLQLRFRLK